MKQQAIPPLPPGYNAADVLTSVGPQATGSNTIQAPVTPPVSPPQDRVSTSPGAGLSFLNAVDEPFSLFDTHGSLKTPDAVSNAGELLRGMLMQSKDTYQPGEAGQQTPAVVGMARSAKNTAGKITKGNTQEKAAGLGQLVATVLQAWLTGKAMGKLFPEGMAPKPMASWQGPIEPQGPPTPPQGQIGTSSIQMPESPVKPPAQLSAAPAVSDAIDVPYVSRPSLQGPSAPPGGFRMQSPVKGMLEPKPQLRLGEGTPSIELPPSTADPKSHVVGATPEYVIGRGFNQNNKGQFGRVPTGMVDPEILRKHLESKAALEAEVASKAAKAPKPPTKSPPKPKVKK